MDDRETQRQLAHAAKTSQTVNIWLMLGGLAGAIGFIFLGWTLLPHDFGWLILDITLLPIVGFVVGQRVILELLSK